MNCRLKTTQPQAVGLSRRLQTTVQIVSKHPTHSNGARFTVLGASRKCGPAGWLTLLLIKAGDVEINPGSTPAHKQVCICDTCHK